MIVYMDLLITYVYFIQQLNAKSGGGWVPWWWDLPCVNGLHPRFERHLNMSVFKGELQMRIGDSLDLSSFLAYILTVYVQLNYRVFYLMYVLYITSLSQVYQT